MDFSSVDQKNKSMLIENIGKMYRDSKIVEEESCLSIKEEDGLYAHMQIKDKIDEILKEMRLEYAYIIRKEFLEENDENWYEEFFSKEEYELYKKGAIDAFLHALYG